MVVHQQGVVAQLEVVVQQEADTREVVLQQCVVVWEPHACQLVVVV